MYVFFNPNPEGKSVGDFWNVYVTANIQVPRGCCFMIAVENTSDQAIDVQNANIKINRTA